MANQVITVNIVDNDTVGITFKHGGRMKRHTFSDRLAALRQIATYMGLGDATILPYCETAVNLDADDHNISMLRVSD